MHLFNVGNGPGDEARHRYMAFQISHISPYLIYGHLSFLQTCTVCAIMETMLLCVQAKHAGLGRSGISEVYSEFQHLCKV